ncbi:TetR/AcrR family transcriptional regulator [Dactylosporangium matsuzakiense]|uniref:TetR family transcriptional regulator n=1 Tax=Dactylosporangium matsuzakiense TaxID=53360 RepID=A0A9W6KGT5_9ACTN|nr:TetR/AcrR family transcriptional regulator [Dactylosporangium matsuzakiense]UWZ46837.1 TetR/AcrR family transcriptional regulator [Dactylosporangium matsuzakiense]GLL01816.1 TetR family transcriptional regulator [Dactylosporangium matsuzakiense]
MPPTTGNPERRAAICDAVFELLGEVGYDRMTMDAVAARARASKATIYRGWPSKPELVMEAVEHRYGGAMEPPDTGSLRGDLYAQLSAVCTAACGADGAVFTGLLTAATHNGELAEVLYRCTYETKHSMYESMLKRAAERGEVPEGTSAELLHEVLHAMVTSRRMWQNGPLDEAFVARLIDCVLIPILQRG